MSDGCAGIDVGDGYDCYGQPVYATGNVLPYYSPQQLAVMRFKLDNGAPLTLAEQVAIRSGVLGPEAAARLAQPLPAVNVPAVSPQLLVVILIIVIIYLTTRKDS